MHGLNDTRPPAPFIGVRSYDVEDAVIFHGRDADTAAVANLVADKARWRLILLHGMTGSGKSSFLKAGLMPLVTSDEIDTGVFHRADDSRQTLFISAGFDPLVRLAEAAAELIGQPEWWRRPDAPKPWDAAEVRAAGESAAALAAVFEAMAPLLRKPLLLIVDQAEEVFTLARQADGGPTGERFFDFLAAFCRRPNWIQVLISMRTEFYGRYDHALRERLGAELPVAPYLLASPTAAMLEEVMRGPCGLVFADPGGRDYGLRLEDGIERRLAEQLVQGFPGPGALTAMQVVGVRLVKEGLERAAADGVADPSQPLLVRLTPSMLAEIGPVEDVIEDLVDEAIGNFFEREGLMLFEILRFWNDCARTFALLVAPQAEGAPVTRFLPREQFLIALSKATPVASTFADRVVGVLMSQVLRMLGVRWKPRGADYWLDSETRLLQFLESHNVRVLRSIRAYPPDGVGPLEYLALGHDILAVGMARANARAERREGQSQRSDRRLNRIFWFGLALCLPMLVALFWTRDSLGWWHWLSDTAWSPLAAWVALVPLMVMMAYELLRQWRRPANEIRLFVAHNKCTNASRRLWIQAMFDPVAQTARFLNRVKTAERQEFPESESVQPFPGAARF